MEQRLKYILTQRARPEVTPKEIKEMYQSRLKHVRKLKRYAERELLDCNDTHYRYALLSNQYRERLYIELLKENQRHNWEL